MARIALDFCSVATPTPSGVEMYIYGLARNLPAMDVDNTYYLFVDKRATDPMLEPYKRPNVTFVKLPVTRQSLLHPLMAIVSFLLRINLFHFPSSIIPRFMRVPSIITIYDVTYEKRPDFYVPEEAIMQKREIPKAIRRAAGVLTISQATQQDIIKYYSTDASKVHVIYLPLPERNNQSTQKSAQGSRKLPRKFILAVGNVQPRKNYINLVKALPATDKNLSLLIAGKPQDKDELTRIKSAVKELKLGSRVDILGYVSDQLLEELYSRCVALVYPSHFEGYGYPIIEAFAHDVPVITSNQSCMPEIAAGAALYIDPNDPESITKQINDVFQDKRLASELVEKGRRRLKRLQSYDTYGQTSLVYKKILEGTNG